jgi:hypothetical protein
MGDYHHSCLAGCGKIITWRFAICAECEKIYGSSPYDWPEWLRYLWRSTQKERRQIRKQNAFEVNIDDEDCLEARVFNSLQGAWT